MANQALTPPQTTPPPLPPSLPQPAPLSPSLPQPAPPTPSLPRAAPPSVTKKSLATSAANLSNLLPTGTVLVFETLVPSFSNNGECFRANKYLTLAVIILCSLSCFLSSFTDSFIGNAGPNEKQLIKNLPLGAGLFGSFLFIMFPTKRRGIGYGDITAPACDR
ncbi:protein DMP3-like isoform X2 [Mercurialis annua]|uniref:protein DMP3-like isoform X2 n=1 Tax=Mercurialis annua TaxID=3986 RepID=UPI0024AFC4FC|nr:protein DMP3-like isoform X2 [Mercurialis annua]